MIYQSLYDLVSTYIFGGVVEVGSYQELVTILVSTVGSIGCIALPFVAVLGFIKVIWNSIT